MRYLVTGGLGYLGSRLTSHLLKEGHQVRVTTRRSENEVPAFAVGWDVYRLDYHDDASWGDALEDIDFIFNLAGPDSATASSCPIETLRFRVAVIWTLFNAIHNRGYSIPFINLSTIHVYGHSERQLISESTPPRPDHPYALAHLLGENVTRYFYESSGTETLNVRLSNIFGSPMAYSAGKWNLVFNDLCRQSVFSGSIRLKCRYPQVRNFITMEDAVRGLAFLSYNRDTWPDNRVIHLGSSRNWDIVSVAERVADRYQSIWNERPEILLPDDYENRSVVRTVFDIDFLKKVGFTWKGNDHREIDETLVMCRKRRDDS